MKRIHFTLFLVLLSISALSTIRRVNNTPGVQSVYTTFSAAVAAANSGDTIHLEPSGIDYVENADVIINKKLAILGNGSNLSSNPGLQADTNDATIIFPSNNIWSLKFITGSQGSFISCAVRGRIKIETDSVTLDKCYLYQTLLFITSTVSNPSSIKISRSFITSVFKDSTVSIWFTNCIIKSFSEIVNNQGKLRLFNFENCIVALGYNFSNNHLMNSVIVNSIITRGPEAFFSPSFTNCSLTNNIFVQRDYDGLSAADSLNNQFINHSVMFNYNDMSNIYAYASLNDFNFKYKSTFNPGNIGPYVGNNPYTFGTVPTIPSIYQLTVPSINTTTNGAGNTMPITISTRINQ